MLNRNTWTGTQGSGLVGALPENWDEARKQVAAYGCNNGNGDIVITPITSTLLARAYEFLVQSIHSDPVALKEIQQLTVTEVVEWYLDF